MNGPPPGLPQPGAHDLRRLFEAPLRRPWHVVVPFVVVFLAAIVVGELVPKRYVSSTLILVAAEKLPDGMIRTMATERATRRLQTIQQEITSRTLLERVVRELDPYNAPKDAPLTSAIDRMRDSVRVNVKGTDAFSIEFEHTDPRMAMRVAERLTSLFMDEVVGSREKQVEDAYAFIDSQLVEARRELERKEEALRRFKERNMGTLPEQMPANLATLQRLQLEQQTLSEGLRRALDQQALLEDAGMASAPAPPAAAGGEADQLREQLAQLRRRYTDQHPDIQALKRRIAAAERGRPADDGAADTSWSATNRRRLEESRIEVQNLRLRLSDVEKKIGEFQNRVEETPRIEQEILTLTRDYQKLNEHYVTLLGKKLDAQMAAELERRWKGEQFRIVDSAFLPERPSFPRRSHFALAGLLLGLAAGLGLALLADVMDQSIKDVGDLETLLPFPQLAVIPFIDPRRDSRRQLWRRRRRPAEPPVSFEPPSEAAGDK